MINQVLTIETRGSTTRKLSRFLKSDPYSVAVEFTRMPQLTFCTRFFVTITGPQEQVNKYFSELYREVPYAKPICSVTKVIGYELK